MSDTPKKSSHAEREERILAFWNDAQIFKKTLDREAPNGDFVFYDGPPFATGLPHYGHILVGTIKDVVPRYQTMNGKRVLRRWGWDCHGLPIENLIEKELGLATKKDIEAYGIEKFNEAARASVLRYLEDWKRIIPRGGRWIDMDNAYLTMQPRYMESIWWSFKTLNDKGLVYQGFKSMHLCPRCETTLSNFEVNLGYKDITDISVYVKFERTDAPGTYFLAWTTTPWTLPGNVGLAVHPEVRYVTVAHTPVSGEEKIILAEALFEKHTEKFTNPVVVATHTGQELVGVSYVPLFDYYAADTTLKHRENGWKVYAGEFVTIEEGTGIVHIAPAFGEEDLQLGQKNNLPFVQHVSTSGVFVPAVTDFAGLPVKPKTPEAHGHQMTDILIIKFLAAHKSLFAKEKVVHSYPHCWRCETPLLNYASSSWFVTIGKIKDRMIAENNTVGWTPKEIGEGRFGKWLEGARDWAISRSRYWGAPLPVWRCDACPQQEVMGSFADLQKKTSRGNTFVLVRHGEADHNVSNTYSSNDVPASHLTHHGTAVVTKTAQAIGTELAEKKISPITAIYASPLIRGAETAGILSNTFGVPVVVDERLREVAVGALDGTAVGAHHTYFSYFGSSEAWFTKPYPGGENGADVRVRVGAFMYDIDSRHENETIVVVSHDDPLWVLQAVIHGYDTAETSAVSQGKDDVFSPGSHRIYTFAQWPHNRNYERDLHRPYIDTVTFPCSCGGTMKRIPEVFDTWYESGSMPFASVGYPFDTSVSNPPARVRFPADFIAEALDQTRGWFYTLLALSVGLFDTTPYKHVLVSGLVLAEDGRKMSKSLKNFPDPEDVFNRFGADVVRFYLLSSPTVKGEDLQFSEKGLDDVSKKILTRLLNVVSFYELYATVNDTITEGVDTPSALDQWIFSKLNELVNTVSAAMDGYTIDRATRALAEYIDDLSVWYLRRSRDRFKSDDSHEIALAKQSLGRALLTFTKVLAPFMPFVAEDIYQRLTRGAAQESVHLEQWPTAKSAGVRNEQLETAMIRVRELVTSALALRTQAKIAVRQPLATLTYGGEQLSPALEALLADELNVKKVLHADTDASTQTLTLDTHLTEALTLEGYARELMRALQDARKKAGFTPHDTVTVTIAVNQLGQAVLDAFGSDIKKTVGARALTIVTDPVAGTVLELDEFLATFSVEKV